MADARTVIRALVALDVTNNRVTPEQGDEIARLFGGDYRLFNELDERPGAFASPYYHGQEGVYNPYDANWHWKLRQARNDRRNHFFDILREEAR